MAMIYRFYEWVHDRFSRSGEKGEYSAGAWQDMVRRQALNFCEGVKGRVLEVGCGEGLFLAQLAKISPSLELYGVDNDLARIKRSEKRFADGGLGMPHLAFEEAPELSFKDGYFDAVVCINTFFNMPSVKIVKETLEQMCRVSKDGGMIIFDYRNARNKLLVMKYRLARYYDRTVKGLPLQTFDPDLIDGMLAGTGFRIKRTAYVPSIFSKNSFLRSIAPIVVIEAEKL